MKRKLMIAIATLAFATGNTFADNATEIYVDNQTQQDDKKCDKDGKPCGKKCDRKDGKLGERQRMTREQLSERKADFIVQQLGMNESTAKKFREVYAKNQNEVWDAMPPRPERDGKRDNAPKSDAESEKQIKNEFAIGEKLLNIRQKYYKEYSKILSQQQIQRMYELERGMQQRFAKKHDKQQRKKDERKRLPAAQ